MYKIIQLILHSIYNLKRDEINTNNSKQDALLAKLSHNDNKVVVLLINFMTCLNCYVRTWIFKYKKLSVNLSWQWTGNH